jgi:hypothetical protein
MFPAQVDRAPLVFAVIEIGRDGLGVPAIAALARPPRLPSAPSSPCAVVSRGSSRRPCLRRPALIVRTLQLL